MHACKGVGCTAAGDLVAHDSSTSSSASTSRRQLLSAAAAAAMLPAFLEALPAAADPAPPQVRRACIRKKKDRDLGTLTGSTGTKADPYLTCLLLVNDHTKGQQKQTIAAASCKY